MKKTIALALVLLLALTCFAGCADKKNTPPATASPTTTEQRLTPPETQPVSTATDAPTTEAPPETAPVETIPSETTPTETEPVSTEPAQTDAPATEPAPAPEKREPSELLAGLTINDAAIVIDGVLYKSEDPYSLLVENGWDFNYEDYRDVDENYVLNKGQYVYSTIRLRNPENYGDSYSSPEITIGLINLSDGTAKIKDCWIHGIKVSGANGFRRYEDGTYNANPCYDFELPGGLRRGDSMEAVLAAWGEPTNPEDTYVADGDGYHYEVLTYEGDHVTYKLTVFTNPDIGLQEVDIADTRNWTR